MDAYVWFIALVLLVCALGVIGAVVEVAKDRRGTR